MTDTIQSRRSPIFSLEPDNRPTSIFVFGSNLAGRHGRGAALFARQQHGAIYGRGIGLQSKSYAIPTKDAQLAVLSIVTIAQHVTDFITFARANPALDFIITPIGTGLSGYRHHQIAPLFALAIKLPNVQLPVEWRQLI